MIWYLYTLQSDHQDLSSYHLSPYRLITDSIPMLYLTSLWLILQLKFVSFNLPPQFYTHPITPLPSGNHQLVLCISKSVLVKFILLFYFLLLLFSHWVLSNSLWLHGLQHARLPCPSLSPGVLKLMSIESVILSKPLILCLPFSF